VPSGNSVRHSAANNGSTPWAQGRKIGARVSSN
jgi:hypothetical protein